MGEEYSVISYPPKNVHFYAWSYANVLSLEKSDTTQAGKLLKFAKIICAL